MSQAPHEVIYILLILPHSPREVLLAWSCYRCWTWKWTQRDTDAWATCHGLSVEDRGLTTTKA